MKLAQTLIAFLLLFSSSLFAQIPATEVRAVWLTTNWGLDWPTQGTSVRSQKEELCRMLDKLQAENFNTILFQARAQGSVFYRSRIEPLSSYFNHGDNFDPLAFAIAESHKRGMECHAWIIAYPMQRARMQSVGKGKRKKSIPVNDKPNYYKLVNNSWYLDPGRPETSNLISSLVKEVVSNYDVDGIHFDYIRYPSNTRKFPDDDTYSRYGNGQDLYDWRRNNITKLVTRIYDEVKAVKGWVQVSSSPLGRYKILPEISRNDGWTAFETVFQDAGYWMQSGKHDLLFPMMYYRDNYFYPYLDDWMRNSNGRTVVPGLGIYQMDEQNWGLEDITNQMKYIRNNNVQGTAYFRTANVLSNLKGVMDSIRTYYPTPAKLPPLSWLDNEAPNSPLNMEVYKDESGYLHIRWEAPDDDESFVYTLYSSFSEEVDVNNPKNILATGLRTNNYSFPVRDGEFGVYYAVTASDRYHNESVISLPAFFSHSLNEQ